MGWHAHVPIGGPLLLSPFVDARHILLRRALRHLELASAQKVDGHLDVVSSHARLNRGGCVLKGCAIRAR